MHKTKISALIALLVIGLVISTIPVCSSSSDGWTLVAERGVKAYPDLKEYVWQKVPIEPPNGPYDKIGLHRLVKEGIEPRDVLLILPGWWSSGEQLISNPPEDPFTWYEETSEPIYWANRGIDVYCIDYRTHFVPIYLEPDQLSFMVEWGWDAWISDIKEAVDLAKEVSGVKRIYLAGESFGGEAMANYASLYWEKDLKGMISLDGGHIAKGINSVEGPHGPPTNTYDLPAKIDEMIETGQWSLEIGGPGAIFIYKYADKYPDAPAVIPGTDIPLPPPINPMTGEPWANITEWAAYQLSYVTNIYEGYGDASVMIHAVATMDRYWPIRLNLESIAISDWDNCPYVAYDFDDHFIEIDVPMIEFLSELYGLLFWGPFVQGFANPDFTGIVLPRYSHLDVYCGEYCARDVSAPTYEWMISHKMLVGWGGTRINGNWNWGKTTIYINSTMIDLKAVSLRVPCIIVDHRAYMHLEFYKGEGDLGWIQVLIVKKCYSVANGPNMFFLGQLV